MRIQITAALALTLTATGAALAGPTSMLRSLPSNEPQAPHPVVVEQPSKGLPWLTKWFGKPSTAPVGVAPQPAVAYQPAANPPSHPSVPAASTADASGAKAIRELGHAEDRQGNLRQAEALYRQAIAVDPSSPAAVNDLGLCLARQGQLDPAVATFGQAIGMRPDKALYRNNIATVLVEMSRSDEALAHLKAVYPVAVAQHNLGQLLARSGRTTEAADRFREALVMDPNLGPARDALSRLTTVTVPTGGYAAEAPVVEPVVKPTPTAAPNVSPQPTIAATPSYGVPPAAATTAPRLVPSAPPVAPRLAAAPTYPSLPSPVPTPAYEPAPTYEEASAPAEPVGVPSFPRLLPPVLDR